MSTPRHFITGTELTRDALFGLIERARQLKTMGPAGTADPLRRRAVALIFERPSTRTRVSFEVGISQLGGEPLMLRGDELQVARGESVRDTALVLSRYLDAIVARLGDHSEMEQLAAYAESTGIAREDALKLAKHCVLGSAKLAAASADSPAQLRKNVTSKGGTTEAALNVFEREQLAERFARALAAATRRGRELGDELAKD